MKTKKYFTWKIERPSGEWDTYNIPAVFSPQEVADKFPHSEVWMQLPAKYYLHLAKIGRINGTKSCWCHYDGQAKEWDKYYTMPPDQFHKQNVA